MPIITVKSKPRTRLAPQGINLFMRHMPQNSCHLSGVAAAFFAFFVFAFLEVSLTMIVTVHFFIWKVRRIRITSPLRRDGANRLRVCCLLFHRPFSGTIILYYSLIEIFKSSRQNLRHTALKPLTIFDHISPLCSAGFALSGTNFPRESNKASYQGIVLQNPTYSVNREK